MTSLCIPLCGEGAARKFRLQSGVGWGGGQGRTTGLGRRENQVCIGERGLGGGGWGVGGGTKGMGGGTKGMGGGGWGVGAGEEREKTLIGGGGMVEQRALL